MRKPIHLILLAMSVLISLFALSACGTNLTTDEYLLQAKSHLEKGDLRAANIELANALQRDPEAVEARWLLAQVSLELGDAATAESEARRAIQLGMSRAEVQPVLVEAVLRQGALDRTLAETASLPTEATDSDKAKMLGLRGQAFVLRGDIQRAQAALEDALSFDSQASHALVGLAVLHATQRQPEEARRWATAAIESNPDTSEAWSVLGELELAQGNLEAAEAAFGNAIQHRAYPTLDRAHRALARVQLGKLDEAASDIQWLQRRGLGEHYYVHYVGGLILFTEGNFLGAASAFEDSFTAEPGYLPNRMYLATARLLLGQSEQARRHAQYVYNTVPQSHAAGQLLASAQMRLTEYARAKELLHAALADAPDDSTTLRMLATVSLLTGDAEAGLEFSRRLVAQVPDSSSAQEMLLLASLLSGVTIEEPLGNGPVTDQAGTDVYRSEFLRALEAFRDNRLDEALQRARRLHEREPERVDPVNLMAAVYLAAGQWDRARIELEKVLEIQPNEPSALLNLAKIELQTGDVPRAKSLLERLLTAQPESEEAALWLAQAEVRLGDRAAGIRVLEDALRRNPSAHSARARLAGEHLQDGNLDRVLALTHGLSDTQRQAEPALLEVRGKAQVQRGDLAAARETFARWIRFAPESVEARVLYGDMLARSGDHGAAKRQLDKALELDPLYLPARIAEIRMLVHLGSTAEALSKVDRLKEDFGEAPEVLGLQGWLALGTGDFAAAEQALAALWEQSPDSEVTLLLVQALWAQAKHDDAIALMREWLDAEPEDLAVLVHLAEAYLGLHRSNEAIAAYEAIIQIYPTYFPAWNNIAWLSREEDPSKAMTYAERAYELAPEEPRVLDTLGMLKLEQGDLENAYQLVREAADRLPADAQIQLHLGTVLVRQQRLDEAREVLAIVAAEVPDSAPGREAKDLLDSMSEGAQ